MRLFIYRLVQILQHIIGNRSGAQFRQVAGVNPGMAFFVGNLGFQKGQGGWAVQRSCQGATQGCRCDSRVRKVGDQRSTPNKPSYKILSLQADSSNAELIDPSVESSKYAAHDKRVPVVRTVSLYFEQALGRC